MTKGGSIANVNNSNKYIDTDKYINNIVSNIPKVKNVSKSNEKCAPGIKYEAGSCARLAVLVEMAKAYNKSANTKDKIRLSPNLENLNPQKYKAYLVEEIGKRIGDKCTNQKCWGQQEFIQLMEETAREEFLKYTHRPDSPQGKFDWLSTFDINDTMEQYYTPENKAVFFGAVPMDFATLSSLEISNPDYQKYYNKGIRKFGVIFNLDNHNQPGSHWTAMYTDLEKGYIFYFDSFGKKPEPRVRELMRKQARFLESIGKNINNIRTDYNKVQHQKGNTECGVYSINFLIRMARGDDFDKLCNNSIDDRNMNKCRRVYFDKYNPKQKK